LRNRLGKRKLDPLLGDALPLNWAFQWYNRGWMI